MNTKLRALVTGAVALACLTGGLAMTAGTASAAGTYPVKTTLDGRTVKDPDVAVGKQRVSDMYAAGSSVTIECQSTGPSYGGSTIWDLTDDGLWIGDAYVTTGSTGTVQGACAASKSFPAKADLNGRKNKGDDATAAGAVVNKYKSGTSVPVNCQATSDDEIWDHTTDNLWVPDQYVTTGTDGFVLGIPRCDTDGIKAGGSTPGDSRAAGAITWAKARLGHTDWDRQCELFVEEAYGTSGKFSTATSFYQWQKSNGRIHTSGVAPAGALAYFTSTDSSGHVMLVEGGGKAISTGPSVYETSTYASRSDYLGWAYAPTSWPGR